MAFISLKETYQNEIENQYDSLVDLLKNEELEDNEINVLWTGGAYMFSSQSAPLSQKVLDQRNGIIIRWQRYSSGAVQTYGNHFFFIPKSYVEWAPGRGMYFPLVSDSGIFGVKYLYINNTSIAGNDLNSRGGYTGNTNGVYCQPNMWVMTQVLGI